MTKPLFQLKDQVAIVTGCTSGLGQGMALALAQAGADIVGVNRSVPDETRCLVEACGRSFLDLRGDLTKQVAFDELIELAAATRGHVDVLEKNAGIIVEPTPSITRKPIGMALWVPI